MNINEEIAKLKTELENHNKLAAEHAFQAKAKEAKLRKLQKQLDKINEIINEQLPPAI
jgi:hypothetical protein